MRTHHLEDVAEAAGADLADVITVARVELSPGDYDDDLDLVTDAGRQKLLTHFLGGQDPGVASPA